MNTDRPTGPAAAPVPHRVEAPHLRAAKERGEPLTMLTAYDGITARVFDEAGIDLLLVGDSVGIAVLGYTSTIPVTVEEIVPSVRAVARATRRAMVIADLPFGSYEASPQQCHATAVRMVKEGGAHGVKVEGGAHLSEHVRLLTLSGIPVVGHLGTMPQLENMPAGARVHGGGYDAAERIVTDALALAEAGAVAVLLDQVPPEVADRITEVLPVPTIGLGAGPGCDGQVLVWTDMAGFSAHPPAYAQQFGDVAAALSATARNYARAVRERTFPGGEHPSD